MNKKGGRRKMVITIGQKKYGKLILSTFSSPFFGGKSPYDCGHWLQLQLTIACN
jgi:hypothetical protein